MNRQPDHWPTLFQSGQNIAAGGDASTAAVYFWNAATLAPRRPAHWQSLGHILALAKEQSELPLEQYFAALKTLPGFDYERFATRCGDLVSRGSLYAQIKGDFVQSPFSGNQLCLSLLTGLLTQAPMLDLEMENHLVDLRTAYLQALTTTDGVASDAEPMDPGSHALLCALAIQCFLNEFLYPSSDSERTLINQLLATSVGLDEMQLAAVAAYQPLHRIQSLALAFTDMSPWTSRLLRIQVQEPQIEYKLAKNLHCLTAISDKVSDSVKQQYEENPYPRWFQTGQSNPRPVKSVLTGLFPRLKNLNIDWPVAPDILIAGCGSGRHPILTAGRFAEASILAIDLSQPSLAYAVRKATERGIKNIEFAQADILGLGVIDRHFDIIESTGVLHHMADPIQGLCVLRGLLKNNGLMRLGFYSEYARDDVVAARELVDRQQLEATPDGLRSFRQLLIDLPEHHRAKPLIRSPDFFTMSGLRDLAFNIQEHRYTLEQIANMLEEHDLEFLGFEFADPDTLRRYRARFPADNDATALHNWHEYEQEHPDTFASMYQFWVVAT